MSSEAVLLFPWAIGLAELCLHASPCCFTTLDPAPPRRPSHLPSPAASLTWTGPAAALAQGAPAEPSAQCSLTVVLGRMAGNPCGG